MQWQNLENQTLINQDQINGKPEEERDDVPSSDGRYVEERDDSESDEDDPIIRFLEAMEDQDLHFASSARLRQYFSSVTMDRLEEGTRDLKLSRILLEDRNFSVKTYRPYPRPMTAKQLYIALGKQVRKDSTYKLYRFWVLTTIHRDTLKRSHPNPRA